jgi:hypothetical protein
MSFTDMAFLCDIMNMALDPQLVYFSTELVSHIFMNILGFMFCACQKRAFTRLAVD